MFKVSKPVQLVFEGGFMDGQRLSSGSSDRAEAEMAIGHYFGTSNGTVGKRFRTYSEAGLRELYENTETGPDGHPRFKKEPVFARDHYYEVAERVEDDDSITLRFRYLGKPEPGGSSRAVAPQ